MEHHRLQLDHELAQIELDKRQLHLEDRKLQLERRELDVKQRLLQLNAADLTEDEPLLKLEPHLSRVKQGPVAIRISSPSKPSRESPMAILTADSVDTGGKTDVFERIVQPPRESNAANPTASKQRRPAINPEQVFLEFSTADSWLHEALTDDFSILPTWTGGPEPSASNSRTSSKRAGPESHEETETGALSEAHPIDTFDNEPGAGSNGKPKRRRVFRAASEVEKEDISHAVTTEPEEQELISHYRDAFLDHMHAFDQRSRRRVESTNTIASKVRQLGFEKRYSCITLLHREFTGVATKNIHFEHYRDVLGKKIERFENALPYWSPKCKRLSTQKDRLAFVSKVVEAIAGDEFDEKDYKNDYDPYDEL